MTLLPAAPGSEDRRTLALAACLHPWTGMPSYLRPYLDAGAFPLLANAAGWAPHWEAAAVYAIPRPREGVVEAQLVIARRDPPGASPRRTHWAIAALACWPAAAKEAA